MDISFDFKISAASGDVHFDVRSFEASEWISKPFNVSLELASTNDIDFDEVLAKSGLLTISSTYDNGNTNYRYFNGIIRKFIKTKYNTRLRRYEYEAILVPSTWLLSQKKDYCIYQGLPVLRKNSEKTPTIVEKILEKQKIGFTPAYDLKVQESYPARDYCAQFNETELNFITRLLEDEGIYYYFEHSDTDHTLIFGDSSNNYNTSIGSVLFHKQTGTVPTEDYIYDFQLSRQIHPGKVTLRDFDFTQSSATRLSEESSDIQDGDVIYSDEGNSEGPSSPSGLRIEDGSGTSAPSKFQKFHDLEEYNYPGSYTHYDSNATPKDGVIINDHLGKSRLEEAVMFRDLASGESVCARFCPGYTFTLTRHDEFDDNDKNSLTNEKGYVLTEVIHKGSSSLGNKETSFSNTFVAIPSSVTFRPQRNTPKVIVRGPQTAIVVNSQGDIGGDTNYTDGNDNKIYNEVNTDEYGRVQVRFNWARPYDNSNYDSNHAWVRVSQAWAGQGWGSMHIPHVGQEVIVEFLDGDPDRPIITGRVYNGENEPYHNTDDDTMKPDRDPYISGFRDEFGNELIFDADPDDPKIKLGNKHDSITLDKWGFHDYKLGDRIDSGLGNVFDINGGFNLEFFSGAGAEVKAGAFVELVAGQVWEFFFGGKFSYEWGYNIESSESKKFSKTESDILSLSDDDQLHASGDGFCIAGGTKDGNDYNAIINAYKDALVLSFGERQTPIYDTAVSSAVKHSLAISSIIAVIAALQAVLNSVPEFFDSPEMSDTVTGVIRGALGGIFGSLYTAISMIHIYRHKLLLMDAKKAEPVFHEKAENLIALNEDGITLGIKPEEYKRVSGPEIPGVSLNPYDKIISETISSDNAMKSRMSMKNDGSISINSNGDRKNIYLSVGDQEGYDNSVISLRQTNNSNSNLNGISLISDQTMIKITKGDKITIDTSTNNADIILKAGGGSVTIDASEAEIVGSTFSKTQGATIASNLTIQP